MRISTIIITKNAAKHLRRCLDSVLWTDEIIILDSGSSDETVAIGRSYGTKVQVSQTDWPGFGKQKNRALKLASGDWILSLDADEVVTPALQQEIIQVLQHQQQVVAYTIPRLTYYRDQPIKHCFGHNKDRPIRLLKQACGYFSDDIVHETMIVNGQVGSLKQPMQHFSFAGIEDIINKMHHYSTLGAIKLYQKQAKITPLGAVLHSLWIFLRIYVLRLGFLDGYCGFIIAFSNFEGVFYKYTKLMEMHHQDD